MQIILTEDVKGKGKKGTVIKVKDGYGMNYLVKNGYAVLATKTGVQRLEKEISNRKEQEKELIASCEKIKEKLAKETLVFKVKTSKDGRVFGSVSTKQISDELKKKNYDIDKKKLNLSVPLSSLGFYDVEIQLHKSVVAIIKVQLVGEK